MAIYALLLIILFVSELKVINGNIISDVFGDDALGLNNLSRQEKCVTTLPDSTQEEGICKTRTECLLTGGIPRGRCGLLSTCCAYSKGCGRTSNSKVSYFSSGLNSALSDSCTFNVLRANENVCQIRLDFLTFQSNPPIMTLTGLNAYESQCSEDNFFVTPYKGLPQICGYNTGQHIYLHLPQHLKNISLNMKISKNINTKPHWNIKITQLECPKKNLMLSKLDKELVNDYNNLAPEGCLQYFITRSGDIRSFGYDGTRTDNSYASHQKYAMCFKRTDDICGVNFRTKRYRFLTGPSNCDDYLEVPGVDSVEFFNGKICNEGLETTFSTISPGPLHVDFYATSTSFTSDVVNTGFDMTYEMKTCTV